jgi:uncharacterized protein YfdQ (DUF2303 family)
MKEILKSLIDTFRPVTQDLGNGRKAVHQDYKEDNTDRPIHFKPPIARHVLSQSIINKEDFISFVNEYKTDATKMFYNQDGIKAIFNYSTKGEADHGDSICVMKLQHTDDYAEFVKHEKAQLTQKQFVRFLKRMEPFIIAMDNQRSDSMDIIEMAEHLQAIKTIDSVQRNAEQKFHLDVNILTGKSSMTLPRIITLEFPVFANDRVITTRFEVELFLGAENEGALSAELICYNIDQLYEETIREITASILEGISDVKAFQS